ncbi:MAG: hypothetical protein ACRCX2_24700 [Paraclostridium sp.]
MRKFTKQQVDFICYQIGEWYVQWKNQLVNYENRTHRLGYAKEDLKTIICGEDYEDLEDEYDPNFNISKKPWETEPDFLEFIDESTGYKCFIQRHPELKHLCGYVELPKEHKLYGKDNMDNEEIFNEIDVHGGVTYTNEIRFKQQNYTIDYVVGFDCAHAGDYLPFFLPWGMNKIIWNDTYKDIEYVTNECKKLAKKLKELE